TFNNCSKLQSVDLSGVTSLVTLSEGCFAGCAGLENLETPSSLKLLEFGAFQDCKSLKSFDFKNVETVLIKAFLNCSSLTSLNIPSTMKTIGESAFAGCTSIESVEVSPDSWDFEVVDGVLYNNTDNGRYIVFVPLNNPVEHIVLSQEVKEISNYSFAGNVHLKSITLAGNDIVKIGDFAFAGCTNLESLNFTGQLSRLELIGESAFEDCSNFKGINLKGAANLTTLGGLAFKNCSVIESFDFSDTKVQSYSYNSFAGCSSLKELKLNNSYEYLSSDIVEGCYELNEILLSGAIQYSWNINSSAFAKSGITNIIIGEGSKVFQGGGAMVTTDDGTQIFMVAPAVTGRVEIPEGVISSSWGAFSSEPAIETLVLPSSFTGDVSSFSSLAKLSSYEVHSANPSYSVNGGVLLNHQGDQLLSMPANLATEYTTPSGVKSLASNAIAQNGMLERFIGGADLELLENNSITNCSSLTSITLSENFIGFGDMAVMNCDNLKDVTINSTSVPAIGAYSFGWYQGQGITFYVPDAMHSNYKAESSWDNYNVQPLSSTSSPEISKDEFNVYIDNGNVVVETSIEGATLTLYNLTGNILDQTAVNANRTQLNMNGSGCSVVIASIVLNGERVFVKKLVL
ncbi:MAG: leucine-rich repeat protein, partial [Bacteroidales bacterium]